MEVEDQQADQNLELHEHLKDCYRLLMVQKSGCCTSWGKGSWKSHYLDGFFYIPGGAGCFFPPAVPLPVCQYTSPLPTKEVMWAMHKTFVVQGIQGIAIPSYVGIMIIDQPLHKLNNQYSRKLRTFIVLFLRGFINFQIFIPTTSSVHNFSRCLKRRNF